MTSYLDRLNLRPFEKRLVVGVAAALFVVVNLVFVFPHFSDWGKVKGRMYKAQRTLKVFQDEIHEMRKYQADIGKMETEGGQAVPLEDQVGQFQRTIQSQAVASGVEITGNSRPQTRTNDAFFIEQNQTISVVSQEHPLVDFLYNLGAGNSMIRVRELSLKPDAPRQKLAGNIKLVASYQKKTTPKPVPSAAASGPVAKPASKPAGPLGKTASSTPKQPVPGSRHDSTSNQPPNRPVKRP
jgi:Tfp pilus assembly protein PilO